MNEPTIALNTYTMSPDKKLMADAARRIRYPDRTHNRKKSENRRLGLELYEIINNTNEKNQRSAYNTADFQAISTIHIMAAPIANTSEESHNVFMAISLVVLCVSIEY